MLFANLRQEPPKNCVPILPTSFFRVKMTVHFFMSALIRAHLCMKTVILLSALFSYLSTLIWERRGLEKGRKNWERPNILSGKKLPIPKEASQRIRGFWYCFKTAVFLLLALAFLFKHGVFLCNVVLLYYLMN